MKRLVILLSLLLLLISPAEAKIFKYVDDTGKMWYVDREEAIPEQYRAQPEIISKPQPVINPPNPQGLFPLTRQPLIPQGGKGISVKNVEVFMAPDCFRCKILESFLKKKGIRYIQYDISQNNEAKTIYQSFGHTTLPLVKIGEIIIAGYNPNAILKALKF